MSFDSVQVCLDILELLSDRRGNQPRMKVRFAASTVWYHSPAVKLIQYMRLTQK